MSLWSTVDRTRPRPGGSSQTCSSRSAIVVATVDPLLKRLQVGDEVLEVGRFELDRGHDVPGLDGLRIVDPAGQVPRGVRYRSGSDADSAAEVGEVRTDPALCRRPPDCVAGHACGAKEGISPGDEGRVGGSRSNLPFSGDPRGKPCR